MALVLCPECGTSISSSAKMCPSCGYPINEKKRSMYDDLNEYDHNAKNTWEDSDFNTPGLVAFIVALVSLIFFPVFLSIFVSVGAFIVALMGIMNYQRKGFAIAAIVLASIDFVFSLFGIIILASF